MNELLSPNPSPTAIALGPVRRSAVAAEPLIRVGSLGKSFRLYDTPWGRLVEWLTLGRAVRHQDFWALRDVNFDVRRGESLGIIGVNGSGKSTLLKILSGAMYPTTGDVAVRGRVLSLLELGTGLNSDLTGRQNVINSARLLGFPADYAQQRMGQIESFAELAEFFDRPTRLYSSGMLVRLSFSMFACFDPEIFIVDEALSVGDVFFQQKCARRIQEMRAGGTTMLFVSHDLAAVEALCDRVLLLHQGRVRHDGDKKVGISLYYAVGASRSPDPGAQASRAVPHGASDGAAFSAATSAAEPIRNEVDPGVLPWRPADSTGAFGGGHVEVEGVCFRRDGDRHDPTVEQGAWLDAFVLLRATRDAAACNVGLELHDRMDRLVFARSWLNADLAPAELRAGDRVVARFSLKVDLEPGEYILALAAGEALPDPMNPTGWNQDVGGARYAVLPRAAVVAVTPRADRRRTHFGPANLTTQLHRQRLASDLPIAPPARSGADL